MTRSDPLNLRSPINEYHLAAYSFSFLGGRLPARGQCPYEGVGLALPEQRAPVQQRRRCLSTPVLGHPSQGSAQQRSAHRCLQASH